MSTMNREQLLALALGVLPELPASIDVLSTAGGSWPLTLSEHAGDVLHGYAPAAGIAPNVRLLARVSDSERGGYEIEFEVVESFFHTAEAALVLLAVTDVRRRKARRAAPRAPLSSQLIVRVRFSRTMPRDTEVDVRLADVSVTGLAFVSRRTFDSGDLIRLVLSLAGRPIDVEARVVRVDPAPYGRHRIGCEITEITDDDRRAISTLAGDASEAGTERERRPDVNAAFAEARAGRRLTDRMAKP